MGAASKYWKLVRIDAAGKRKVEEIAPAKAFFCSALPEFSAQTEVADTQVQRQLIDWIQSVDTPQPEGVRILRSMTGLKLRTLPHLTQRSNLPKRLRSLRSKFRHDLPYLYRDSGC